MTETPLKARTASSQLAAQKNTNRLMCDSDNSTDDLFSQDQGEEDINLYPYNQSAEEAVIACVLINPDSFDDLNDFLRADDFYIYRNRWIWEAFQNLRENDQPIDYLMVNNELKQRDRLSEVGGPSHLTELLTRTPSALNAVAYGQQIKTTSICRQLGLAANQIARYAYQQPWNSDQALDKSEQEIFKVSLRNSNREIRAIKEVMSDVYDHVINQSDGMIKGIPTGYIDLDRMLGGMHGSDLIILGARPAVGKTSFLTTLALHVAQVQKKNIAIFSLEMSNQQLAFRLLAQDCGIDGQHLRTGNLSDDEWGKFTQAVVDISELPMVFDDTPALTIAQLRSGCRKLRMQNKLDLVLVDYIQLMASDNRFENRVQEVGYISRQLKVLARELDVPILAAAQLSRAVELRADKRPILSDLRESGNLEMDADIVLFLHRVDDPPEKGLTEVIIAKHRQGPTGVVWLGFQESTSKFVNITRKEE
jgi:replicative DNA helicase